MIKTRCFHVDFMLKCKHISSDMGVAMGSLVLPIGVDDYKEVAEGDYDKVDKTLFIKSFLEDGSKAFLIIRPRRFGKSYNLSMLKYFFDIEHAQANRALFEGTAIATATINRKKKKQQSDGTTQAQDADDQDEQLETIKTPAMDFQGKYPVIKFTLKGIRPQSHEAFMRAMRLKMCEIYEPFDFLLESDSMKPQHRKTFKKIISLSADDATLGASLKALSQYLYDHYQQPVMILCDEYDTPIHSAYLSDTPFHEKVCDFMKVWMGEAFKGNQYLKKGLITGILRIGLMDLFSAVNSLSVRGMMQHHYAQFFGFTQEETTALIRRHSTDLDEEALSQRLAGVKDWYNGYTINNILLYNPWSILQFLDHQCKLSGYWNASGENSLLGRSLLNSPFDLKAKLTQLLQGEAIDVPISERTVLRDLDRDEGALWHLLLSSGYLTVVKEAGEDLFHQLYKVRIPNKELWTAYRQIVEYWYRSIGTNTYARWFQSLQDAQLERFEDMMHEYLEESVSVRDLGKKTLERYYHVFLLGMFFSLRDTYHVQSNKESGYGYYDLVLIPMDPKKPGYVFEFKVTKKLEDLQQSAEDALAQIDTQKYDACFQPHNTQRVIHIGMSFYGKDMHMVHREA